MCMIFHHLAATAESPASRGLGRYLILTGTTPWGRVTCNSAEPAGLRLRGGAVSKDGADFQGVT